MYDVIVIGGGAAGMMAAIAAAREKASVLILEHMELCGKKILSTGNGIRKMKKCRKKLFSSLQQLLWISEERMKFSVRK